MSSTMKRLSAIIAAFFTAILLVAGVSQLAWAEEGLLTAGNVNGDLTAAGRFSAQEADGFEEQGLGNYVSSDGLVGVYGLKAGNV